MKNKKIRYRNTVIIILVLLLVTGIFGYLAYSELNKITSSASGSTAVPETHYITSQDFTLRTNANEFQEDLFNELNEAILSEDASKLDAAKVAGFSSEEYIASLVAQNFVADFYTWTNKTGNYDVGGLTYIYSPHKVYALYSARDGFYYNLTNYQEEYGEDNLLEVVSVETVYSEVYEDGYEIDGVTYPCYKVKVAWEYKDTDFIDDYDMETTGYFKIIINDDGRYEIVETYGDR